MAQTPQNLPVSIGRFRIESRLGAGGMGEVSKGFDPGLMRSVAVKTVRPDMAAPEYIARRWWPVPTRRRRRARQDAA